MLAIRCLSYWLLHSVTFGQRLSTIPTIPWPDLWWAFGKLGSTEPKTLCTSNITSARPMVGFWLLGWYFQIVVKPNGHCFPQVLQPNLKEPIYQSVFTECQNLRADNRCPVSTKVEKRTGRLTKDPVLLIRCVRCTFTRHK